MLTFTMGKGGSGKSKIATLIAARAAMRRKSLARFDCDVSNGSFRRLCGTSVKRIGVDDPDALIAFLENDVWSAAAKGDAIADLGSGAERVVTKWLTEANVLSIAEVEKVKITFVHVLDGSKDALVAPNAVFDEVGGRGQHILVLNGGRLGPRDQFEPLMAHEMFRELIRRGAKAVHIPRDFAAAELDKRNTSILQVMEQAPMPDGHPALNPFDQQRARAWFKLSNEALDKVEGWLP